MRQALNCSIEIRGYRFIPIIFFTARPHASAYIENPPFVQTVPKGADDIDSLARAVENVISSGLPHLLRSVSDHLANVERAFMADFVERRWSDLADRKEDVAYLLSRRLAVSFEEGVEGLAQGLGQVSDGGSADAVHPTRYYVQPPSYDYRMGDLLAAPELGEDDLATEVSHVILTPSCDLVSRSGGMKAERVILAECRSLDSFEEYRKWKGSPSNNNRTALENLLKSRPKGQEDRYFYLPEAWNVPDVVVDLQSVSSITAGQLEDYEKIASLDSPFAEALSQRFNRYIGRVGTPDLDIGSVVRRLQDSQESEPDGGDQAGES